MIEAMKQALEALESDYMPAEKYEEAITSLRQAIAEAEKQEPVAWVCYGSAGKRDIDFEENDINDLPIGTMLYTHPQPKQEWVGLTNEEIEKIRSTPMTVEGGVGFSIYAYARMIEAKLKEKNT